MNLSNYAVFIYFIDVSNCILVHINFIHTFSIRYLNTKNKNSTIVPLKLTWINWMEQNLFEVVPFPNMEKLDCEESFI